MRCPARENSRERSHGRQRTWDVSLDTQLLIDGKTVKGQGCGETIVNPASGKKIGSVPGGARRSWTRR